MAFLSWHSAFARLMRQSQLGAGQRQRFVGRLCACLRRFTSLVTQTSALGSIGVLAMHVDQSAHDIQQGYRFTSVTAGDFKARLLPT